MGVGASKREPIKEVKLLRKILSGWPGPCGKIWLMENTAVSRISITLNLDLIVLPFTFIPCRRKNGWERQCSAKCWSISQEGVDRSVRRLQPLTLSVYLLNYWWIFWNPKQHQISCERSYWKMACCIFILYGSFVKKRTWLDWWNWCSSTSRNTSVHNYYDRYDGSAVLIQTKFSQAKAHMGLYLKLRAETHPSNTRWKFSEVE